MKRILLGLLVALSLASVLVAQAAAQTIYPLTLFVLWDAPDPTDNVTHHTLVHNNGISNTSITVPMTACTATECRQSITVPGASVQTISLTATNQWGTSIPTSITFTAKVPGNSRNIRISTK